MNEYPGFCPACFAPLAQETDSCPTTTCTLLFWIVYGGALVNGSKINCFGKNSTRMAE